jgi:hypothetical protein
MTDDTQKRLREDERYRNAICDWLRANGIDPVDVPADAKASVTDGDLSIPVQVRNENGRVQIDPNVPDTVMRHTVTVPLKVPPTAEVQTWLMPTCPSCGR